MNKLLLKIVCSILIVSFLIWGISILNCEFLTFCYGNQFSEIYKDNTMIGEIDYLKVLKYSKSTALVYYVSKNRSGGNILAFSKHGNNWVYEKLERTVWSKHGSADGFVWPYIR